MKTLLYLFCLFFISFSSQAQAIDSTKKFIVTGRADVTFQDTWNLKISLTKGQDTLRTVIKSSKFEFALDYNKEYMITVEKGDYTRRVSVLTTNIPPERWNQGFDPYPVLFLMYTHYSQDRDDPLPAATVSYSSKIKDFEFNKNEGYEGR